jgi:hypothetical protein
VTNCRRTIEQARVRSCQAATTVIGADTIIRHVTTLRLIVLMLLAVLLPLRGTLAAAQPCLGSNSGSTAVMVHAASADHHAGHGEAHHADPHAGHHPLQAAEPATGATAAPADPGNHDSGCQASACCLMPLATAPPATAALRLSNQLRFPALVTPEPAFQSGGQDRPPRRA